MQLSTETLNDLLTVAINTESPEDFNPDPAIDLWWKDKIRRPNQKLRKPYKKRPKLSSSSSFTLDTQSSSDSEYHNPLLDTWDEGMNTSSSESETEQEN